MKHTFLTAASLLSGLLLKAGTAVPALAPASSPASAPPHISEILAMIGMIATLAGLIALLLTFALGGNAIFFIIAGLSVPAGGVTALAGLIWSRIHRKRHPEADDVPHKRTFWQSLGTLGVIALIEIPFLILASALFFTYYD